MNSVKENWNTIIEKLRTEYGLSNISFETWILPLKIFEVADNTVILSVEMKATIEIIDKKYRLPLQVCIAEVTGTRYEVKFITESDSESINRIRKSKISSGEIRSLNEKAGLNPKYTFETFVVGGNNKFAHAASVAVSESPGKIYNPLFLYGGVGLGKTHLMHSIAHHVIENDPSKKVLYVTSETFTNELIEAIKNGRNGTGNDTSMSAFREKYRTNDVLLIDDVQFIIGKESTQEEFFHTFNHLHVSGKQIIISSDKPPKEFETLEERLRTRFEWGLIADITAPDYETRMAILQKKIELDDLEKYNIPDDVLQYIATHVKSNIRELEGSLNRLMALYRLNKEPGKSHEIDISLAAEALEDLISPDETRKVTPEFILDIVSDHYNVSLADLKSGKRSTDISYPRQVAMYLIRTLTDTPLKTIGIVLGGRDHSTISHGVDKITDDLEKDEALKNTVDILIKKVKPI